MNKFVNYLKTAYNELRFKVTWPTTAELQNSTFVVLVASILIALAVFVMDRASNSVLELYYGLFT